MHPHDKGKQLFTLEKFWSGATSAANTGDGDGGVDACHDRAAADAAARLVGSR